MLSSGILNAQLAFQLARLRHTDRFIIADCGLPVPSNIGQVDLAVTFGVPRFEQVLAAVLPSVIIQGLTLAEEARGSVVEEWVSRYTVLRPGYVPHDGPGGLKDLVSTSAFVIRTGETTPFANAVFECGVPF